VTFLDAYALIAFLVGGPATVHVRGLLREGETAVATANLAETLDVSQRLYGLTVSRAMEALDPLLEGPLRAVSLDCAVARRAAEIRAKHYDRTMRSISLADAALLASANPGDLIASADADVLAAARAEQLGVVALPEQR
jgi:predicted nucleic acid-binding protein